MVSFKWKYGEETTEIEEMFDEERYAPDETTNDETAENEAIKDEVPKEEYSDFIQQSFSNPSDYLFDIHMTKLMREALHNASNGSVPPLPFSFTA